MIGLLHIRRTAVKCFLRLLQALVTCLESGDYIQIRNAILVLQGVLSCFPAIVNLANVIDKRIEKVSVIKKRMEWFIPRECCILQIIHGKFCFSHGVKRFKLLRFL